MEKDIKKIAKEEMTKSIMENLDSSFIFTYIQNLEKELDKKDKIIDLMARTILSLDDQLVINHYKNKEEVIERFRELLEEWKEI